MRVVVATDRIGGLGSAEAGRALAVGWPQASVDVRPVGTSGGGFVEATAERWGVELVSGVLEGRLTTWAHGADAVALSVVDEALRPEAGVGPIPGTASSYGLGRALRQVLWERTSPATTVLVDLAGLDTHDGGAGLLAALGAVADVPLDRGVDALAGLGHLDLDPVRELLRGARLLGVVPSDQTGRALLGLRGITSLRGRQSGFDPAALLATDAALSGWAGLLGPGLGALPGAGACGGLGLAVLALGGSLATGPALAFAGLRPAADLVVTGCSVFDFASRGGGVVAEAARWAAEALCPCVVVAGEVLIGAREMRTMGIEAAYPVRESSLDTPAGGDPTAVELAEVARRVGRSWSW